MYIEFVLNWSLNCCTNVTVQSCNCLGFKLLHKCNSTWNFPWTLDQLFIPWKFSFVKQELFPLITFMWLGCLRPSHRSNQILFNMQNYLLNQNHKYVCFKKHVFNRYYIIKMLFIHDICLFWVFNKNWLTLLQYVHFFMATVWSKSVKIVLIAIGWSNCFAIEPD